MKWRLLLAVVTVLSACAEPKVKYTADDSSDVPVGAIRFKLESTAVAFSADPVPPSEAGSAHVKTGCALANDANWTPCFQRVKATPAIIGYEVQGKDPGKRIYIAEAEHTLWNMITTSYVLASEPAGDDELLPKQITISSQDNLKTIVATAGSGAVTGFTFGPVGGAVGAVIGAGAGFLAGSALASVQASPNGAPALPAGEVSRFVCPDDLATPGRVDFDKLPEAKPKPILGLPFVIKPGPSSSFVREEKSGPSSSFVREEECWHPIPNNTSRFLVSASGDKPSMRKPVEGDGWFYRIAAAPIPENEPATKTYSAWFQTAGSDYVNRFPVSACRDITIQVLWWPELLKANAAAVKYNVAIADPDYITSVPVRVGSIVFHQSCGAYAKNTFAPSPEADRVSAISKAISDSYKAQSDWQKAKASSTP